ncbi:MAG: RNA polymerase sigma-70 factor [Bacteroidota bacterium]
MTTEDKKLIDELILGKETAFDEIFRKYYRRLVYFSMNVVKNKDSAEEVVQDLFVTLWEKKDRLQLKVSLKAYLYRAVYNNSVQYYKKQQRFVHNDVVLSDELADDYKDILEQSEMEERIYQTIEQLPDKCKEIFKLKRFDELKNREIAEQLQISIKTVETQMTRALKYLTKNLGDLIQIVISLLVIGN